MIKLIVPLLVSSVIGVCFWRRMSSRIDPDMPAPLWTGPLPDGSFASTPRSLRISRAVLDRVEQTVGRQPAESGGMLGGSRDDFIVRNFVFDRCASRNVVQYSPNCEFLNSLLRHEWNPRDVYLLGFIHSHPRSCRQPSIGDLQYAERILEHVPDLPYLLMPIVMTRPDHGRFEILPFAALRDRATAVVRIVTLNLEVLEDDSQPPGDFGRKVEVGGERASDAVAAGAVQVRFDDGAGEDSLCATFQRVEGAYDLSRLAASRVVAVGAGGSAQFLEDLARAGVGEFVIIDPDVVSESNLATQQVYRRDLGRPKVDCVGERIRDINPHAVIVRIQKRLNEIDDREFQRLAGDALRSWKSNATMLWGMPALKVPVEVTLPPAVTLLGGFTDNFEAQARINRLALHLGHPSLCAQVYHEGRGAEVTFTYPGTTPACHRCALSSRYTAYLQDGYRNQVTSDGTPIFATSRLNAIKGFVALALLHHGTPHPRWGKLLERIGPRNLIQVRMDPDLALATFERVFAGADHERLLFDEVVWLPQKPDCPANNFPTCPDCGGSGDLREARGTFDDTRVMRT